jgi:hypothetical protein
MLLIDYVSIQQALQKEVEDSKRWIECTVEDSTYKRDLYKRIELINWALDFCLLTSSNNL